MRKLLCFSLVMLVFLPVRAQKTVTEVYSDYRGWWSSAVGKINKVAPDDSHNLIAFKVDTTIYSTGVNNAALRERGIQHVALLFKALPIHTAGAGGIIGLGSKYSGDIVNDPIGYLTDGINGLDLCTGMFNWTGSNTYDVSSVSPAAIDDGIPDILIPQIGDPSNQLDKFRFIDSTGATVGKEVSITFYGIEPVANNDWKFYTRANPPRVGAASAGHRSLRIIAYDYADLGITTDNYNKISKFVHVLSGTSDQPFIAYNHSSFNVVPVTLQRFAVVKSDDKAYLHWVTSAEAAQDFFTVERSPDQEHWKEIGRAKRKAGELDRGDIAYSFIDTDPLEGNNFYRLRITGMDGNVSYSAVQKIELAKQAIHDIRFFPNPAKNFIEIMGMTGTGNITISAMNGKVMARLRVAASGHEKIDISSYPKGVYVLKFHPEDGRPAMDRKFMKE